MIAQTLSLFFQMPKLVNAVESALLVIPSGVVFLALIQLSTLKRNPALFLGCLLIQMKVTSDRYITAKMLAAWLQIPFRALKKSEEKALRSSKYSVHISAFRYALWVSKWNTFIKRMNLNIYCCSWLESVVYWHPDDYSENNCKNTMCLSSNPKLMDPYDPQAFNISIWDTHCQNYTN
eukprot:NODE_487_length_7781_cov_0.322572.p4 type:complete len:178 gc:universal NODE_487_length_7781_cov_0.322572:1114-581(-)